MIRREYSWLELSQYAGLAIIAALGLLNMYRQDRPWWFAAGLLLALAILYYRWPSRFFYLYLAAETALVMVLLILDFNFVFLCFVLSAHVAILIPSRTGALWIVLVTLANGAVLIRQEGWVDGLLLALVIASGNAAFALFNYTRVRAEIARRESQALLEELQDAHRRLRAYADRVEELAVAEERNRLAREMHDTLGHRLTVAAVQLEGAQRLIPSDPERAARMVGTVREQVREALGELRRAVATLRTPLEADLSLPHALARLAAGFEQATGLAVHLTLPEESPALPDTHRLAIYRAAQEALTNVQRHAQAQEVWLQLTCQDRVVALLVGDDGVGIPADADAARASFGLRGLRERAVQLGGELALESRPGGGTQVSFRLPLPAEEADG